MNKRVSSKHYDHVYNEVLDLLEKRPALSQNAATIEVLERYDELDLENAGRAIRRRFKRNKSPSGPHLAAGALALFQFLKDCLRRYELELEQIPYSPSDQEPVGRVAERLEHLLRLIDGRSSTLDDIGRIESRQQAGSLLGGLPDIDSGAVPERLPELERQELHRLRYHAKELLRSAIDRLPSHPRRYSDDVWPP